MYRTGWKSWYGQRSDSTRKKEETIRYDIFSSGVLHIFEKIDFEVSTTRTTKYDSVVAYSTVVSSDISTKITIEIFKEDRFVIRLKFPRSTITSILRSSWFFETLPVYFLVYRSRDLFKWRHNGTFLSICISNIRGKEEKQKLLFFSLRRLALPRRSRPYFPYPP